eukprot:8441081-Alexandrium_andersonii.AAC.1
MGIFRCSATRGCSLSLWKGRMTLSRAWNPPKVRDPQFQHSAPRSAAPPRAGPAFAGLRLPADYRPWRGPVRPAARLRVRPRPTGR